MIMQTLKTLTVDGRNIAYQDSGTGPPVILAHCSSATHVMWAPVVTALSGRYRVLVPDLLGYGQSEAWPLNARLHPWSDLTALVALADIAGEPAHLVGHSYGGAVALEAARVLGPRASSLTLIEPVAFHFLRLTQRMREWAEVTDVGQRMTWALRLRQDRQAAAIYMKYWVGRLGWWTMSRRTRRRVVDTMGKVGAEFEAVLHLARTIGDYRFLDAPTRLIVGERTRRPARAIVDELRNILSHAHLHVLARAGHMSPLTHPEWVAALVTEHIEDSEQKVSLARKIRQVRRSIA